MDSTINMKKTFISNTLCIIASIFFIISILMLAKGIDKMINYDFYDHINAYINNDEANYIINSNYATGFFILSMGSLITGTILTVSGIIIRIMPEETLKNENDKIINDLPEL